MNDKLFVVYAIGDVERRVVTMPVQVLYYFTTNL